MVVVSDEIVDVDQVELDERVEIVDYLLMWDVHLFSRTPFLDSVENDEVHQQVLQLLFDEIRIPGMGLQVLICGYS